MDNRRVLDRYAGHLLAPVYEAGYGGFRLHDRLVNHGIPCLVTPPSLVPRIGPVKTGKQMLNRVWVPREEERDPIIR